MLIQGPHTEWPAAGDIPAGLIVAWEGTIASIPNGWALCDGTGGTPDLSDRFVIGADDGAYSYNTTGGSATSAISGVTSSDGAHQPIQANSAAAITSGISWVTNSRGSHSHSISGTVGNEPPYYSLSYIMAFQREEVLPSAAVLWVHDIVGNIPNNFAEKTELRARTIKGVTTDIRANGGNLVEQITLTVATDGAHAHHFAQLGNTSGGANGSQSAAGSHNHTQSLSVSKQMIAYHALTAIECLVDDKPKPKFVCAFYGLIGSVGSKWALCDGSSGTPDLRARQPVGQDGGATYFLNDMGGANSDRTCSAVIPSSAWVHDHSASLATGPATHASFDAAHGHTYSSGAGQGASLPPYRALHYVKFMG